VKIKLKKPRAESFRFLFLSSLHHDFSSPSTSDPWVPEDSQRAATCKPKQFFRHKSTGAYIYSDLPADTAGTGRVHPRRAAGKADTGRQFFFSKPYPTCLIHVPVAGTRVRVRRYSGTGTRFFFGCFFPTGTTGSCVRRVRILI
jgi:hypothetical protein